MTEFRLRDNLDSNDPAEYVVVMGDTEYARYIRLIEAEDKARRVAASNLVQGSGAFTEVVFDRPGHYQHGVTLYWVDITLGHA